MVTSLPHDAVSVRLGVIVVEEGIQAVPVASDIGELVTGAILSEDAGALVPKPLPEVIHRGSGASPTLGEPPLWPVVGYVGVDHVELGAPSRPYGHSYMPYMHSLWTMAGNKKTSDFVGPKLGERRSPICRGVYSGKNDL